MLWALLGAALTIAAAAVIGAVASALGRRRRRRTVAILGADIGEAPQLGVAQALGEPAAATRPQKVIVVTGCDSAHYELVLDLLASLADAGRAGFSLGLAHAGEGPAPAALAALVDQVAEVGDDEPSPERWRGYRLAYLMVKARLPELFPGYDAYVWLDGDTWVQNRAGVDQVIHAASLADVAAHPELDPDYFRARIPSNRLLDIYQAYYGRDEAALHVRSPMFNSGVFSAMASSPLWSRWRDALMDVRRLALRKPDLFFSDQVPLHRLIASGRLSVHPLRAVNNWLVHAATPSVDLARRRVLTPNFPHDEINIVHLTASTKDKVYVLGPDGRGASLRYRSIKALFAASAAVP